MIPDWLTIIPDLPIRSFRHLTVQPQFAWNHCLGEITLADEIWDDVNVFDRARTKQKDRVAQTRLFFPKCAGHIAKNVSSPDLSRMRQRRRARIRIHGRAMTDDQKSAVVGSHRGNVQQPALSASRMGPTLN